MKAAHRPHIIVSENPLTEGQDYTSLCGKIVVKAYFIATEGDVRRMDDWLRMLWGSCRKCDEHLRSDTFASKETHVYFAVDGQLAEMYQKSEVPEIQRLID